MQNISGLNLAVVKLTTVQVTKPPLWHKISTRGMICFAKPGLTEDWYIMQKQGFSIAIFTLDKAKHIHKRQTNSLVREDVT
jgi:hypothetical protein